MRNPIFGIDLGTTNSCLALLDPAGPRVIAIDGQPLVPSVVSLDRARGEMIVGQRARNRLALEPEATVRSIKRRMGTTERVMLGDRALLPEEIAAEILRYLKEQGERACGLPVERAVITVPAYFGDAQRRATIRAGELAGLEVVRLLNEPTAAALVYDRLAVRAAGGAPPQPGPRRERRGRSSAATQRILVYDLGGGTFDVSVVEIGGEINEVRASCGDNHLGGDDFDRLLVGHVLDLVREGPVRGPQASDPAADPRLMARLDAAAEQAKIELSTRPFARVIEEALGPGFHLDVEIARATFEELIQPHLDRTLGEVARALAEARLEAGQLDRVVLVGGSTHIPRIAELLGERFACPIDHAVDPALGVALGAALQGGIVAGRIFDQILVDVSAHSLGVKTADDLSPRRFGRHAEPDHFSTIIRRNSQIPTTRSEVYFTMVDDQHLVAVEVYQGESPLCSENTLIGDFPFALDPAPAGSPVVVEFSYDLDGIIRVVVSQKDTDNRREVTFDTRLRAGGAGDAAARAEVDNYILRKARALAASLPASEASAGLRQVADRYAAALARADEDADALDRVEAELLDLLEESDPSDDEDEEDEEDGEDEEDEEDEGDGEEEGEGDDEEDGEDESEESEEGDPSGEPAANREAERRDEP